MKVRVGWLSSILFFALTITASAQSHKKGPDGEIPVPFNLNQTVELADGEGYQLLGRIFFSDEKAYFLVNLDQHPWLANANRKANPYYLIEAHPKLNVDLRDYENRAVVIKVRARSILKVRNDGSVMPDILLRLLALPENPYANGQKKVH